jgi:hypothetical protein
LFPSYSGARNQTWSSATGPGMTKEALRKIVRPL